MSNTNKPTNTGESALKTPVANPTLDRTEEMDIELTTDGNPNPPGQAVPLVESIPTLDESTAALDPKPPKAVVKKAAVKRKAKNTVQPRSPEQHPEEDDYLVQEDDEEESYEEEGQTERPDIQVRTDRSCSIHDNG